MIALEKPAGDAVGVLSILTAAYAAPYKLRITFSDGLEKLVDFEPFLRGSHHPSIRAYIEKRKFKAFAIENGYLHWNDFDLVFPMVDLRAGRIT